MKHISTVLEPSISFHTLVKHVDAEDIANKNIRTHDLALELNNITNQLLIQNLDSSQQKQLLFTQPRDPNNQTNLHIKNISPIVIEQITPSLLVSKNNEMMKTKEMHMLDRKLLKCQLYSTFVLPQTTEKNDMIHIIEVEVIHEIIITTKIQIHKTDIALHSEIDLVMTKNYSPTIHSITI